MAEHIKQLIMEHWTELGTKEEQELINSLEPQDARQYIEAMNKLETDENYAKELGIIF